VASLTAWKFDSVDGADRALEILKQQQQMRVIQIQDGAVVKWEDGKKKPKTEQLASTVSAGALGGAFWGMLFGLIFFVPLFGAAVGAISGALMGKFTDYGIDDRFIDDVKGEVTPGTSALFLLAEVTAPDKVMDAMKEAGVSAKLISSNLTREQEDRLRAEFGVE
jgi:uncharacterized membrane protein